MGHLGTRVSALLDGQLASEETERAWAHVHACHACRDLVEREGWIKTQLAGLSFGSTPAPDRLKGSLLGSPMPSTGFEMPTQRTRRPLGLVAIGGGAAGAAVVGVLALGAASPDAPVDRRPPITSIRQSDAPRATTPSATPTGSQHRRHVTTSLGR